MLRAIQLANGWASEVVVLTSQDWGQVRQQVARYRGPRDYAIFNNLPGHSTFQACRGRVFLFTVVSLVLTVYSMWPREGVWGIHELMNVARIGFVWGSDRRGD